MLADEANNVKLDEKVKRNIINLPAYRCRQMTDVGLGGSGATWCPHVHLDQM